MPKRKYLPYGLTKREKRDPKLRRKLASCIRKVEERNLDKGCPRYPRKITKRQRRKGCVISPVAVCRASITGTRRR